MSIRSYLKGATVASLAVCAFVACTNGNRKVTTTSNNIDAKSIVEDTSLEKKEKAEKLALAAEQLITPGSFFHADDVLNAALEVDPDNKRAQLYKAIVGPWMVMKGIYKRVEPMVQRNDKDYADYKNSIEKNYVGFGNRSLQDFLLDGQGDIHNEVEAQQFIDEVSAEYEKSRKFFNENMSLEMAININHDLFRQDENRYNNKCTYTKVMDLTYEVECETGYTRSDRQNINRGELEALKAITSGMQVYTAMLSAYNLDGFFEIGNALSEKRTKFTTQKEVADHVLSSNDNIGNLRNKQALQKVLALGIDGMAGLRWVQKNQNTLCPLPVEGTKFYKNYKKGYSLNPQTGQYEAAKDHIRRENFVLEQGLCVDKYASDGTNVHKIIDIVEMALKGNAVTVRGRTASKHKNFDGSTVFVESKVIETEINVASFLSNPLDSVRDLPKSYNDCGNIESFTDNTLGGIFVNENADKFLSKTGEINKEAGQCAGI